MSGSCCVRELFLRCRQDECNPTPPCVDKCLCPWTVAALVTPADRTARRRNVVAVSVDCCCVGDATSISGPVSCVFLVFVHAPCGHRR